MATDALSAAITNPLSIDVMAAATHPYRVPLREGDPLHPLSLSGSRFRALAQSCGVGARYSWLKGIAVSR